MKRISLCLIFIGITQILFAQQIIEKSFSIQKGQPVRLKFDFPKVKVSSWNKNEVKVKVTLNINDGKNNDKFRLLDKTEDGTLIISDTIDFKHIDQQYYAELNGEKKKFDTKEDFENFKSDHKGEKYSFYSSNNADVQIEVLVPSNESVVVQSKFGMVEIDNYTGSLTVKTEFGKINAKLKESNVGNITLTNQFGKIYSNFDLKPTSREEKNFYTSITASPGKGPNYSLISKFGNIYLRDVK
ncbi:MAG: hypothetical protein DI598_09775 [Pseudopedobacter saltans]|uniref:Adhesin domain-containing protein n=1 Tax=Pseudopedobacter saltans TaxID=151895 RepID=A0A2W5F4V0_9SPHI|nr:MAG: hypothetical protein DI598_09775 [Pseudopedobacter saltans]